MAISAPQIVLRSGRATAVCAPGLGGRVTSLAVDDLEMLAGPGNGPLFGGLYPMAPWAGRLRDGLLAWGGQTTRFPAHLTPPHAIHGTLLERAWTVLEVSADRVALEAELVDPWPFGGSVRHEFVLSDDALTCRLEVHATNEPFPAVAGWHPWFRWQLRDAAGVRRGGRAEIGLPAGGMLRRGEDGLPDGTVLRPYPEGPWDDCFLEFSGAPTVTWPDALRVTVLSDAPWFVVLTARPEGICVEPQTGPPNGLNDGSYTLVESGAPLVATMSLGWETATGRP